MYRKSSMREWVFPILSDISGAYFSVTKIFLFSHSIFCYERVQKKQDSILNFLFEKKKETLGLLTHRRNKATEPP